jgi:hypothetical protein
LIRLLTMPRFLRFLHDLLWDQFRTTELGPSEN